MKRAEHERQQPRVRVVGPLQQHDKGDQQKRNRVQRQDLLHQLHQRTRLGPGGRLWRQRQILSREQREGGLEHGAVALDLQPDDLTGAAVAAHVQEGLVPIEGLPVERADPVPDLQASLRGWAVGRNRGQFQAPADRPEHGVDADDDLRLLTDQVHPGHAVERQERAEGYGQGAGGGHGGIIMRLTIDDWRLHDRHEPYTMP